MYFYTDSYTTLRRKRKFGTVIMYCRLSGLIHLQHVHIGDTHSQPLAAFESFLCIPMTWAHNPPSSFFNSSMSTKIALLWEDSNRTATKLTDETTVISEEKKTPSTNVSSICHKVYTLFLQFSFRSTKGDTPQQTTMTTKPTTTTTTTMMMIMICEQPWPHKCSYYSLHCFSCSPQLFCKRRKTTRKEDV